MPDIFIDTLVILGEKKISAIPWTSSTMRTTDEIFKDKSQ